MVCTLQAGCEGGVEVNLFMCLSETLLKARLVTVFTACLNINNTTFCTEINLWVLYETQIKQRRFPCGVLMKWSS
jgi:hypothetical protein